MITFLLAQGYTNNSTKKKESRNQPIYHGHMVHEKTGIADWCCNDRSYNERHWENFFFTEQKVKLGPYFISDTKINSR